MESMGVHKRARVLELLLTQRGHSSLWPLCGVQLLPTPRDGQHLRTPLHFGNDNSGALESCKILLCTMEHLLQMPVGKLRQVEAKRKLNLCYVQQTSILRVSRHGLTLGKKPHFFPEL